MNSTSLIGPCSAPPRQLSSIFLGLCTAALICSQSLASIALPIPAEEDWWSDLRGSLSGSYDFATETFSASHSANAMLDIGAGTAFDHQNFNVTISISGLQISHSGAVTPGGVLNVFLNSKAPPPPAIISSTLPYPVLQNMLTADITDVKFKGIGVLEMAFNITGGTAAFEFGNYGGLTIGMAGNGSTGASAFDFSASFALGTSAPVDIFGLPEPTSFAVASGLVMMSLLVRTRSTGGLR